MLPTAPKGFPNAVHFAGDAVRLVDILSTLVCTAAEVLVKSPLNPSRVFVDVGERLLKFGNLRSDTNGERGRRHLDSDSLRPRLLELLADIVEALIGGRPFGFSGRAHERPRGHVDGAVFHEAPIRGVLRNQHAALEPLRGRW